MSSAKIDVFVSGPPEEVSLMLAGNRRQSRFLFTNVPSPESVALNVSGEPATMPYSVDRALGVIVSTHQSDNICRYTETPKEMYLLICSLLGLTQWRALSLNALLAWEDFFVRERPPACLFAQRPTIQEYALAFEHPFVCDSCLEFLRCLGAESETLVLQGP